MFKNRSIQMKLVKDETATEHTVENHYYYPNMREVRNLALMAGVFYTVKTYADLSSKIILDYATKK